MIVFGYRESQPSTRWSVVPGEQRRGRNELQPAQGGDDLPV